MDEDELNDAVRKLGAKVWGRPAKKTRYAVRLTLPDRRDFDGEGESITGALKHAVSEALKAVDS